MEELMSTEKKKESSVSWVRIFNSIFLRKKVISNVHKKPSSLATIGITGTCLVSSSKSGFLFLTLYSTGYFRSLGPTLKIFVFPLTRPCFSGMGQPVGRKTLFFNFSN